VQLQDAVFMLIFFRWILAKKQDTNSRASIMPVLLVEDLKWNDHLQQQQQQQLLLQQEAKGES